MAARTTTGAGTVSNSDGSVLDGGTPLGLTDTLTISHSVTLSGECGTSPSTGGTAAVTIAANSITVTIPAAGFVCKGPVRSANNTASVAAANVLKLQSGASFTFKPASGQQYGFDFASNCLFIDCEGSANPGDAAGEAPATTGGNHCTVKTDLSLGGLAAYTGNLNFRYNGFRTVTYTDFIDMGTTTQWGVRMTIDGFSNATNVSLTSCTFTRSNYRFDQSNQAAWPSNFTFQYNSFNSSVLVAGVAALGNVCASFSLPASALSAGWLIDTNGFDDYIEVPKFGSLITSSNNIYKKVYISSGSWSAATSFSGNISTETIDQNIYGPIQNCYAYTSTTTNPHFVTPKAAAASVTGCVFDPPAGVDGAGDAIFYDSLTAVGTVSITGNLVLSKSNKAAGTLLSAGAMTSGALTVNHNTGVGLAGDNGLAHLGESTNSFAGQLAACKSNLLVASAAGNFVNAVADISASPGTNAVTAADYNAFRNPSSGTCKYNTSTSQAGVVGYSGVVISANTAYPNATVGAHDLTVTSDPFVDSTRSIETWAAYKGQAGTAAAAIAYAVANPAAATDATTGLRAWVRDGFKVTDATLKDAGHDGVTIGAVEFASSGGGGIYHGARMRRLLRP